VEFWFCNKHQENANSIRTSLIKNKIIQTCQWKRLYQPKQHKACYTAQQNVSINWYSQLPPQTSLAYCSCRVSHAKPSLEARKIEYYYVRTCCNLICWLIIEGLIDLLQVIFPTYDTFFPEAWKQKSRRLLKKPNRESILSNLFLLSMKLQCSRPCFHIS